MSFEAAVHAKAIRLGLLSLDMCAKAGSGHPTSALSLGHLVTVLLYHAMRWVPDDPTYPTSDRLVLSEGHAVPVVYAAFADLGGAIERDGHLRSAVLSDLDTLRVDGSSFDGHPNPRAGFPFFDAATGSLGQGLSVAAGLAIAARHDDLDRRIYCIIGDGESREGQVWEALDLVAERGLANLLPIFNCNGYGQADAVSDQQSPESIARKIEAFGIEPIVIDGHDPAAIRTSLEDFAGIADGTSPRAIVARTIKGWGAASLQGHGWHGKPPRGEALDNALSELEAIGAELTSELSIGDQFAIQPPNEDTRSPSPPATTIPFGEAMERCGFAEACQSGRLATRKAYGAALQALGHADPRVWALDADVKNSTFSLFFAEDEVLQGRFVECRIAEQNMISTAVGLSATGKVPFCSTFAKFVTRAYDQIEMALTSGANIKIVGTHAGISLAADGPSQMGLPDVAWFRALATMRDHRGQPGCHLLQPADAWAAFGLTLAMAEHEGLCAMRVHRPDVEFLYDESTVFELGGMEVLMEGRDLLIVSAGYMVHECNKALDELDGLGIDATLVDCYSIPFPAERLLDLANDNGGAILVVEDNYGGGLGAAVADACAESGDAFTVEQLHVRRIPGSARSEEDILLQCGLHHHDISRKAAGMLGVVSERGAEPVPSH